MDAGVIIPGQTLFGESIRFRHGLVRQAAYDLLLRKQRKNLHAKIAETLIGQFPSIAENRPHLIALQWIQADQPEKAISYWIKAGQLETERSA